jgi:hypothetical protein
MINAALTCNRFSHQLLLIVLIAIATIGECDWSNTRLLKLSRLGNCIISAAIRKFHGFISLIRMFSSLV